MISFLNPRKETRVYLRGTRAGLESARDEIMTRSALLSPHMTAEFGGKSVPMCVDATPLAEWVSNATREELDALLLTTPLRPAHNWMDFFFVHPDPDQSNPDVAFRLSHIQVHQKSQERRLSFFCPTDVLWSKKGFAGASIQFASDRYDYDAAGMSVNKIGDGPSLDSFDIEVAVCALALMNVRNVGTAMRSVPRHIRRQVAKAFGVEKAPEVIYRTLTLRPFSEAPNTMGSRLGGSRDAALHLVRGHFATYTETNKLFGRHTGTFWVPTHARGRKESGEVRKSYILETAGAA